MNSGESALERTVVRKVALRLIPFLGVLYFFAFLDRVNLGFAALTMNADLGLSATVFGIGAGIFFVGYVAMEVPSNVMLERFGARIWIARIMITWAVLSGAMAFVQGPTSFYVTRFLLGVAEAGFFPGIIYYLTCWFPARFRARIIALFMIALPMSSVIGAPLSTALLDIEAAGLRGWQWMFLLEAIPTLILGFVVLKFLTDKPSDAKWLNSEEKNWLLTELRKEEPMGAAGPAAHGHATGLREALMLPRVWTFGFVYFGILVGVYGFSFWMPQIINSMGSLTHFQVGLATMIPFGAACIALVLWGRHSDRTGERSWHVALPPLVAAAALIASGWLPDPIMRFAALSIACMGIYAGLPVFWALASRGLQGVAAAGAIALINSIGNLGGFLGPTAIGLARERTGSYFASLVLIAFCLAAGSVLVLWERGRERPMGGCSEAK